MQDFASAAQRHLEDAVLLEENGRLPNADHLAGFAAECALKEILVHFLGATKTNGMPYSMLPGGKRQHGHLPALWEEVKEVLTGRTGGTVLASLMGCNPFGNWSVYDRYADGQAVAAHLVAIHLRAARQLLGQLQNALIQGVLL